VVVQRADWFVGYRNWCCIGWGAVCTVGHIRFAAILAKLPSQKRIQEVQTQAQSMTAVQIAKKIAANYEEVRFDTEPFKGNAADFVLTRGNRIILLSSKRFKVGNTGVEPLKKLVLAGEKHEATGYLYVALGEISVAARDYARANDIELVQADRLAEYFDGQANID